jgi:hypothetical protein
MLNFKKILLVSILAGMAGCASLRGDVFKDPKMDFGAVQTVAVMPLQNLSRDNLAGDRVRDVFITRLLATGEIYVLPTGEVARGVGVLGIQNPAAPSPEEAKKLAALLNANAVITGVVREYGDVRSGNATANLVSMSVQMMEAQLGKVVWSASSTRGGITFTDRLFGGGGVAMNDTTLQAVDDIIEKLFK